jgi:DNA-binding Xre family transcriptional regulator
MTKKDLYTKAGIGNSTVTKLGNDESVNVAILEKICNALECDISDIMEMVEKKS